MSLSQEQIVQMAQELRRRYYARFKFGRIMQPWDLIGPQRQAPWIMTARDTEELLTATSQPDSAAAFGRMTVLLKRCASVFGCGRLFDDIMAELGRTGAK